MRRIHPCTCSSDCDHGSDGELQGLVWTRCPWPLFRSGPFVSALSLLSLLELGGLNLHEMAAWTLDALVTLRRAGQNLNLGRSLALARG